MVKIKKSFLLTLVLVFVMSCAFTLGVSAEGDLGSVGVQSTVEERASSGDSSSDSQGHGIADFMKDYNPVTDEQMAESEKFAAPIIALVGNAIGFILILVVSGIVLVTALDLCYIGLPFTRSFLYPQQAGGGMGMGGMGGMGAPQSKPRHQFISDEAVSSVSASGSGGGMSSMPTMGSMPGLGGMPGMGGMSGAGATQGTKSIIVSYLKKRVIFIVVFAVAAILLTSSILTNCGINIAYMLMGLIEKVMNLMA